MPVDLNARSGVGYPRGRAEARAGGVDESMLFGGADLVSTQRVANLPI